MTGTSQFSAPVQGLLNRIHAYMADAMLTEINPTVRLYAQSEANNIVLTFGDAAAIDSIVCGFDRNTHWMQAYNNPSEANEISRDNEVYEARDCGLFTFKLV